MGGRQGVYPGFKLLQFRGDKDQALIDRSLLYRKQSGYSQWVARGTTQTKYRFGGIGNNPARRYPASRHAQTK
jgi:hypothetical protein